MRTCTIPGCSSKHLAGGYCSKHYARVRRAGTPELTTHGRDAYLRMVEKCVTSGDCWVYTGALTDLGYAKAHPGPGGTGSVLGHRLMWEYFNGPIPEGLTIDHLCATRACVNPWHMDVVPRSVNTVRGLDRFYGPDRARRQARTAA